MDMPPRSLEDYLDAATSTWLQSFPNVTDKGIGLRMKNGSFTSEWALVIYVKQKLPESQLTKEAVLPKEIAGLPVDVQEELNAAYFTSSAGDGLDLTKVRPLSCGITISTSSASDHAGTLGCFATRNSDKKPVLVSNYHVLFRNKGLPGINEGDNKVYQPLEGSDNQVATVPNGTGSIGGAVDCAFGVLVEEGSCFCCKHVIPHANKVGNSPLVGIANAQMGQKVFKLGAKTGPTVGKVVNINKSINGAVDYSEYSLPAGDSFSFSNLIMVVYWDEAANDFDPTKSFAEAGDSGSVIYNEAHEIVGLHFGSHYNPTTNRHFSMASHIDLVETALGVTVPGTRNLVAVVPTPPTGELASLDDPLPSDDIALAGADMPDQMVLERWWRQAFARLSATVEGQRFLALAERHSYEIMHLVNHRREVTVTWHRQHGPSFIAAMGRSVKVPTYQIPTEIAGVSRQQLLMRMAAVLTEQGSPQLKAFIAHYSPLLLQHLDHFNRADDLVEAIQNHQWLEVFDDLEIET